MSKFQNFTMSNTKDNKNNKDNTEYKDNTECVEIIFESDGNISYPEIQINKNITYFDILNKIGQNEETVLVFHNGRPVPSDELVRSGKVRILKTTFD